MRVGIDARKIADFGIGTYIRGLLRGLAEIRETETYVVFAPRTKHIPEGFEHVAVDAPHYSLRELVTLRAAAIKARVDVFHAPHYVTPLALPMPLIVTIHDLIHLHQPLRNPIAPLYARAMMARAMRRARRVLTVSEAVKRELVREFGREEKIVVTPNGIEAEFTSDGPRADGRYFLFAGNDKPHKNVALLVEAFSRLRALRNDVQLVLTGADFARYANRDGVIVAGFVPTSELAALMRGAIALVQPSAEEGFGLPAAEAMACGAPVITSTAAALVEITGDAALHVEATADALMQSMKRLLDDHSLRITLSERAIERAKQFSWTKTARFTRDAYLSKS